MKKKKDYGEQHLEYIRRRSAKLVEKLLEKGWKQRIEEAKERGEFTREDRELSKEWAGGILSEYLYKQRGEFLEDGLIPEIRRIFGVDYPTAEKLAALDAKLNTAVLENDVELAEKIYEEIMGALRCESQSTSA